MKATTWAVPTALATASLALGCYLAFGSEHPEAYRRSAANLAVLYAHIAGGSLMAVVGPFLLSRRSRRGSTLRLHRLFGRLYLSGALLAGAGGLYVSGLVEGAALSRLAFICGSSLWLLTGYLAYRRIREGDVRAHRGWAIRNYAITASFLTHGPWVALLVWAFPHLGLEAEWGRISGDWLGFSANLLVAELLVRAHLRRQILLPFVGANRRGSTTGERAT